MTVYFDSFGIEYIPKKILSKLKKNSIIFRINIFRIQYDDSIMCGFYCIAFIEYILAGKVFLGYTNLFDKIIYRYFKKNMTKEEASLGFRLK